ncbi:MAG: hypothetical protein IJQ55_01435, partial [Alphaproteobacteria bacterium]|nr:hypothetical protein [Alphaproteobacteria bacterium]
MAKPPKYFARTKILKPPKRAVFLIFRAKGREPQKKTALLGGKFRLFAIRIVFICQSFNIFYYFHFYSFLFLLKP